MAVALEKLEDQLNCSICLDTYTNPKQLQCSHVYCQQCLVELVTQDQQGHPILTCPNCRQVTPIPTNGVAGLQSAFQINKFLEIVEEHKKPRVAASREKVGSASTKSIPQVNITVGCPEHGGREVELYCETCKEAICFKCIKKDEKHHSHSYEELNEAFERYKEELTSSLEPMEKQLVTIKKALAELDVRRDELSNQQTIIEADIHKAMLQLHETLNMRETELIGQLQQLTQTKLKNLEAQKDQIEAIQAQLSSCLLFLKENLKTSNPREALMMKDTTVRQVKEMTTTFKPDILEPSTEADMIFSALKDLNAECRNCGKVYAAGPPDPSKCYATGKGVDKAVVKENSVAVLQILDSNSQPCMVSKISISCLLVSAITGTRVRGNIERRGQSQYEISYQPTIKGRHYLRIKVEGQHIRESPFPITAMSPVEKLGTPILTIGRVWEPEGVAVNQRGEVVVTEGGKGGHYVTVFSPSGKRLRSFGVKGSGRGQFLYPRGVAVDCEENILTADNGNHCIQKFTAQGEFLTAVGTQGSAPLQFLHPCGITFNTSISKVYVVDSGNSRIQILNSDLSYFGTFGKRGNGKGQFNHPQHIACDSTGNVYVADCSNHRIQVFTAEEKFLRMFERRGEGRQELWCPYGIAIDTTGRVYVSDWWNHSVSVITLEGQLLSSFGREGDGPRQFARPLGVAVDSSGVVYVCDNGNSRVQLL